MTPVASSDSGMLKNVRLQSRFAWESRRDTRISLLPQDDGTNSSESGSAIVFVPRKPRCLARGCNLNEISEMAARGIQRLDAAAGHGTMVLVKDQQCKRSLFSKRSKSRQDNFRSRELPRGLDSGIDERQKRWACAAVVILPLRIH